MSKRRRLPVTVDRLLESIRTGALDQMLIDKTKPGLGKEQALRQLMRRATEILSVSSVTSRPDGFAARTPGNGSPGAGKGGGMTMVVKDGRTDPGDRVPTSATELAALTIIEQDELERRAGKVADEMRTISYEVLQQLRNIDHALVRLAHAEDRWDRLRSTVDLEDAPQCYVASVVHRLPWDEAWAPHVSTRFDNVLEQPWPEDRPVCRWVYDFTRAHGRIPSKDELLQYLARGMVRVQTGTSGRAS